MNFSTPAHVGSVIWDMKWADLTRSDNRRKINELFDGWPPYTIDEVKRNKIAVNINFKEGVTLAHAARRQYENAFLKPENFFTVRVDRGDAAKRSEWSNFLTRRINRLMKRSWPYIQLVRSKFSGVVLHGIGAQMWESRWDWRPRHVAVEDLLIPTDTDTSLENLPFYGVRRVYTPSELIERTHGPTVDKGWRLPRVRALLDSIKDTNLQSSSYTWADNPEKMFELFKQNHNFWSIDSAPSITLWDFLYYDSDAKGWKRCMIQDVDGPSPGAAYNGYTDRDADWVYKSNRVFAKEISHLLHIQFGDLSNKPPFHYHSVRSLGFQLFDVCHLMNRLRGKFAERVEQDCQVWWRVSNPADMARVNRIELYDKGVIQEGLSFVKNDERPQVNNDLIQTLMANYRQLMSEASSAYTQDIDSGTKKEQTATETIAKVNQVNALMGGLLNLAYVQEEFAYREICRRLMLKNSEDKDARALQEACKNKGIPQAVLDVESWDITAEQVVGGGNKMLEIAQTERIMSIRPLLDPEPQRLALHMYVEALSDSKTANALVPLGEGVKVTDSVHDAELSFGSMIASGVPMQPKPGMNHSEQIETLLKMLQFKIQQVMKTGGVGAIEDIFGFRAVAASIGAHIQMLSQDESAKEKVASYGKALGKMMNEVKAMAQRLQEKNGNGQMDPELIASIQADQMKNRQKLQAKEMADRQKIQHKQADFMAGQQRENAKTMADIQRMNATTQAELMSQGLKDGAEAGSKPVEE